MNGIHATLIGRAGHDPEMQYLPDSGDAVMRLSVGVRERRNNENYTQWVRVTFFGRVAEFVNQHVHKGARIAVTGPIQLDNYTRRDGTPGTGLVMRCSQHPQIIDWPEDAGANASAGAANAADTQTADAEQTPAGAADEDIDDLPF